MTDEAPTSADLTFSQQYDATGDAVWKALSESIDDAPMLNVERTDLSSGSVVFGLARATLRSEVRIRYDAVVDGMDGQITVTISATKTGGRGHIQPERARSVAELVLGLVDSKMDRSPSNPPWKRNT